MDNKIVGVRSMQLAITIATYQKSNGKSPYYLTRTLDSIFNQTYQNFKVYLVGDKYENNYEFLNIVEKYNYPKDKFFYENLPYAPEREKYLNDNRYVVWCVGGVSAINHAIDLALADGFQYICHLDHDDYWDTGHLQIINDVIEETGADWLCTKSTYCRNYLPLAQTDQKYIPFMPVNGGLINSSTCINLVTLPIRPRDVFAETGKADPADADRWIRCAAYIKEHNLKSYFINKLTCFHEEENTGV